MRGAELHSSTRTYSSTAAGLTDANGVKTAAANPVVATTYSGAALDGAVQAAGFGFPRYLTVTTTANPASYNTTDPIVVTGTRGGVTTTASLLLTAAGGGETITSATPLETVTSITVPAQLLAGGTLEFGVVDMGAFVVVSAGAIEKAVPFRAVKAAGAGTLVLGYEDGGTDTITCAAGDVEQVLPVRIYASSTADPITAYR